MTRSESIGNIFKQSRRPVGLRFQPNRLLKPILSLVDNALCIRPGSAPIKTSIIEQVEFKERPLVSYDVWLAPPVG